MFNYLGTFNKPTAVNKSITCSFYEPHPKLNVVLAKTNFIEFYNVKNENLEFIQTFNIFGNILIMEKIIENKGTILDNIFILNDYLEFCIISFDKQSKNIKIMYKGHVREEMSKIKNEILYSIEKNYKFILLSPYKNIFRIIFLQTSEREKNEDIRIKSIYEDILYIFPLNKNFPLKDKENLLNEFDLISDFSFDFKNIEKNVIQKTEKNNNKQLFYVIKQNNIVEKKTIISYYNNKKIPNLKNNINLSTELFAMVKLNTYYQSGNISSNSSHNNTNETIVLNNIEKKVMILEPFLIDFKK